MARSRNPHASFTSGWSITLSASAALRIALGNRWPSFGISSSDAGLNRIWLRGFATAFFSHVDGSLFELGIMSFSECQCERLLDPLRNQKPFLPFLLCMTLIFDLRLCCIYIYSCSISCCPLLLVFVVCRIVLLRGNVFIGRVGFYRAAHLRFRPDFQRF